MTSKLKSRKHSAMSRRCRKMPGLLFLVIALAVILTGCGVPQNGSVFLSYDSFSGGCPDFAHCWLTNEAEASLYYQAIGAEDANGNPNFNLEQWKQQFGIANATPVHAAYLNKLDLWIGRDMNCWQPQGTNKVVCYVTNYGLDPYLGGRTTNAAMKAVNEAIEGDIHKSFGTVAMVYDPDGIGVNHDRIAFYAFGQADADGNQPLIRSVALDTEGPKTVPQMCQACHGGPYYQGTHSVIYSDFLPFDVQSYFYTLGAFDDGTGALVLDYSAFDLDNQQEAFRQLNALVLKTTPLPAIKNLINGWYSGNANTPGATIPDDTYIPSGWDVDDASRNLYRNVFRKYCRSCHIAQQISFESVAGLAPEAVAKRVCTDHTMPNAEIPFDIFWFDGVAQSDLRDYFKATIGQISCN